MASMTPCKNWMRAGRLTVEYMEGVATFLKYVKQNSNGEDWHSCPCAKCCNIRGKMTLETISEHLVFNGIDQTYTTWFLHGEQHFETGASTSVDNRNEDVLPRMVDLVNDAFSRFQPIELDACMDEVNNEDDIEPHDDLGDEARYRKLMEDAKQPLYPSCKLQQQKNPDTQITRTELFLATHTRSYGSLPSQELSITTEKIKEIVANDPACMHNDLNHDPVAQVCGLDKRGIVRGLGHIPKTTIIASTPYINEIREGKSEIAEVKALMIVLEEQLENKFNEYKNMILNIGERLAEVQNQISTLVRPMQCSPGTASSQGFYRSGDTSSHGDESAPPPPPLLRVEQICHLTDICSRVVARGRLIRDNAGIPPDCIKVILDVVEVSSANVFGDIEKTLADCGVGDVLVWPRVLTKT